MARRRKQARADPDYESDPDAEPKLDWNLYDSDNDTTWNDREYDGFMDEYDYDNSDGDPFSDPAKRTQWFESLKTEFTTEKHYKWIHYNLDSTVKNRFQNGLSSKMGMIGELALTMLNLFIENLENYNEIADRITDFSSCNVLQKEYIYRMGLHIKPEKLNINDHCVGYKVDLRKLSTLMLKNQSLLKSIVDERKLIDTPFSEFNSELTCDVERRNRLLGKLRFIIGVEENGFFKNRGAKRRYFLFSVRLMNIPLEERLKSRDAQLFCVVSESKLRLSGLTVQDVLKTIADELKVMEVDGVDVEFLNEGEELPEMINVKGALAAVCANQIGMHEILGHRQPRPMSFNCHFCTATESDIQNIHHHLPLLGTDADLEEYDQCVNDILNYEQKKRKKVKTNNDENDEGEDDVEGIIPIKIAQSAKVYKNRFDIYRGCPFTALSGANIWNISPPNVAGDLTNGVTGRLMCEFILVHAVKGLSEVEIATKISEFVFATGKIEVKFEKGVFALSKAAKTGQKLELLSRFGDIFPDNLNVGHKGYELLETLQSFTKLVLSFSIALDDIPKLHLYARTLIQLCLDLKPRFKVFPKLHELLHYSDLTQLYGPLIYFASLKNHKKELLFPNYVRILCSCTSVTQTHLCRRQMLTTLQMNKEGYVSVDLFANSADRLTNGLDLVIKLQVDQVKKLEQMKKKRIERGSDCEEIVYPYDQIDDYN